MAEPSAEIVALAQRPRVEVLSEGTGYAEPLILIIMSMV
jgi:hypothetical protein